MLVKMQGNGYESEKSGPTSISKASLVSSAIALFSLALASSKTTSGLSGVNTKRPITAETSLRGLTPDQVKAANDLFGAYLDVNTSGLELYKLVPSDSECKAFPIEGGDCAFNFAEEAGRKKNGAFAHPM